MNARVVLLTGLVLLLSFASVAQDKSAMADDLKKAEKLAKEWDKAPAISLYNKLLKQDSACAQCYLGLAMIYLDQNNRDLKSAVDNCQKLIKFVPDKGMQLRAHYLASIALTGWGSIVPAKYKEAEQELRAAMEMVTEPQQFQFDLGMVLLKQKRDPEGIAVLKEYLQYQPNGPNSELARRAIQNPRVARENMAPEFSLTTADGKQISLADMKGKVVVVCFWLMGSTQFLDAISAFNKLTTTFSQEPVVFVGVSSDRDEAKWRAFIQEKKLLGAQCLDKQSPTLSSKYSVNFTPTTVVIDGDGVIMGNQVYVFDKVEEFIRKGLKALPRKKA